MSTARTPPKPFQKDAIESGTAVLGACLDQLSMVLGSGDFERSRRLIVSENGYLLFEAPTGSGKTLMAASVSDALAERFPTLWFWFAPFAALAGHAAETITLECANLRPKDLGAGRDMETLASGDLFTTTWAAVATSNRESRRARTDTESLPSVDQMVAAARASGLFIGAVVDEAHHSFRGATQAYAFYRDVLAPDVTILATATPDDADLKRFVAEQGRVRLHRIGVSRLQAVDAGLLKQGVKVAVFRAPENVAELVDFRRTALRAGVSTHRAIKQALADAGIPVVPVLLVQVDSSEGSVAEAQDMLREMGLGGDQVRTHTADEPDPHLLALAADETAEVLIFKMAVGLGFDCPRAYTLVSMRTSRDEEFGVQVVGRILRVERRMQDMRGVPDALRYGYVILSDRDAQTGLLSAAERINAIRSELAQVSRNVTVLPLGGEPVARQSEGGMVSFLPSADDESGQGPAEPGTEPVRPEPPVRPLTLFPELNTVTPGVAGGPPARAGTGTIQGSPHIYPLRTDIPVPRQLRRAQVALDRLPDMLANIVHLMRLDEQALVLSRRDSATILMEQTEVFARRREAPRQVSALLVQREIERRAQRMYFLADRDGMVDVRALQEALQQRLADEYRRQGWGEADDPERVRAGLAKILALRPTALQRAFSEALARHVEVVNAEPLPAELSAPEPLDPARLNIYGVYPADLNTWERAFAEEMDDDITGTILWWHRNPPRKPYSTCLPLPGQPDFYPDFVLGVRDRRSPDGVALVEVKRVINEESGNPQAKAAARHPEYGKVMMVFWRDQSDWVVVEIDDASGKSFRDRLFRNEILSSY